MPPDEVQQKLAKLLVSPAQVKRFHEPKYSLVAYPFQHDVSKLEPVGAGNAGLRDGAGRRGEPRRGAEVAEGSRLRAESTESPGDDAAGQADVQVNIALTITPASIAGTIGYTLLASIRFLILCASVFPQDSQRITVNLDN